MRKAVCNPMSMKRRLVLPLLALTLVAVGVPVGPCCCWRSGLSAERNVAPPDHDCCCCCLVTDGASPRDSRCPLDDDPTLTAPCDCKCPRMVVEPMALEQCPQRGSLAKLSRDYDLLNPTIFAFVPAAAMVARSIPNDDVVKDRYCGPARLPLRL